MAARDIDRQFVTNPILQRTPKSHHNERTGQSRPTRPPNTALTRLAAHGLVGQRHIDRPPPYKAMPNPWKCVNTFITSPV